MQIKRTKDIENQKVSILVYGDSGVGKTRLSQTLKNPLIISAEGGLLSLDLDLPYVEVLDMTTLWEAYELAFNGGYCTIVLDSVSEMAEIVLSHEKKQTKNGLAAYGALSDKFIEIIRGFRALSADLYMTAKMDKDQDVTGKMLFGPSMPGQILPREMVYQFDEVFCLRREPDGNGGTVSALMCNTDGIYQAKDRSGALEAWEAPDLGVIIDKIKNRNRMQ